MRLHRRPRTALFAPIPTDCPVPPEELQLLRVTLMKPVDGEWHVAYPRRLA